MTKDGQLLIQFLREGSERAFGELVTRHIDVVYSAALRVVGSDHQLAEDVTQLVFIHLARKAWRLPHDILLAGWLHRHASYTASKAVRAEQRRRVREQTAMEMRMLEDNTDSSWEIIASHLDEGLNQLRASDRESLVLRFLDSQNLHAVGSALGISENAAQKRVTRALEKLQVVLKRRGISVSASALASVLTVKAVTAAPVELGVSVTAGSLAATGTTMTFLNAMATTKLKVGLMSVIVAASVVTPVLVQHQAQARLHAQDETLQRQTNKLSILQNENLRLGNMIAQAKNSQSLTDQQFGELMRLRNQVGLLLKTVRELSQLSAETEAPKSRNEMLASLENRYSARVKQLKDLLEANAAEKIPELQFVSDDEWIWLVGQQRPDNEKGYREAMSSARNMAVSNFGNKILKPALKQYAQDNDGHFPSELSQLKPYFSEPVDEAILIRWVVMPTSRLSEKMRLQKDADDWVITQRAPVNAARDARYILGLNKTSLLAAASDKSGLWDDLDSQPRRP